MFDEELSKEQFYIKNVNYLNVNAAGANPKSMT